jgi:hypothetical protein
MTQEFGKPPEPEILLPPGWIKLPDNSPGGGRPYYFNTVDHDIQVDIAKVYERVAMSAAANAAAADENSCTRANDFAVPDGVVSSSHNTISPSPAGRNSGRKKSPPGFIPPASFGGWVDIASSSGDDSATEVASTGTQLRESPRKKARTLPPAAVTADNQPTAAPPPATIYASRPGTRGVLRPDDFSEDEMDDEFGSSDVFRPQRPEVRTQDLPNTQDFGGAQALYDLHSGQPGFGSFSKEL